MELSKMPTVDGWPRIFLTSFLLVFLIIRFFCFISKKGTPWVLITGFWRQFDNNKKIKITNIVALLLLAAIAS